MGLQQEGAQVTLHRVQLGGEIADVAGLHVAGLNAGGIERAADGLVEHGGDVLGFLVPIAGEVGLVAPEYVDLRLGHAAILSW